MADLSDHHRSVRHRIRHSTLVVHRHLTSAHRACTDHLRVRLEDMEDRRSRNRLLHAKSLHRCSSSSSPSASMHSKTDVDHNHPRKTPSDRLSRARNRADSPRVLPSILRDRFLPRRMPSLTCQRIRPLHRKRRLASLEHRPKSCRLSRCRVRRRHRTQSRALRLRRLVRGQTRAPILPFKTSHEASQPCRLENRLSLRKRLSHQSETLSSRWIGA